MDKDREVLDKAEEYLHNEVAPKAAAIDLSSDALRQALDGLAKNDLMALRRPEDYGGPAVSEPAFRSFQESVARYSGSLAFLQTQHQSAVSMLAKSDNEKLKQAYLPRMANGQKYVGIGFSQLRRKGDPIMRAQPTEHGYALDGHVPYITGWSFYPEFIIGATLPDGQALFTIVPFVDTNDRRGEITCSEPMRLAAMESALTITADFKEWKVGKEEVVFIKPPGWIQNNDLINITLQGHFALGCARGSLDVLEDAFRKKDAPFMKEAYDSLKAELEACRQATTTAQKGDDEESTDERLRIRAWAISLSVRCAHAAVTVSSGGANSIHHPAQRLYREALVYTVSAQTTAIMEATLNRITKHQSEWERSSFL